MRTEHNWSPYKMWINGMINRNQRNLVGNCVFELNDYIPPSDLETYGIDPQDVHDLESDDEELRNNEDSFQMPVLPTSLRD
jgi:hypothetical protein